MGSSTETFPYWNVNVPESQQTEECPEFLRNLSEKDRGILSTPDSAYRLETWPEVQKIVADNRLELFQRVPSDLRRYLEYNWKLRRDYGSVMNFVVSRRLFWDKPIVSKGKPFQYEEDIKILWNDWPYGIDSRIVHLVVWTKFELTDNPATGDLADQARAEIDVFVKKTFYSRLQEDQVGLDSMSVLGMPSLMLTGT